MQSNVNSKAQDKRHPIVQCAEAPCHAKLLGKGDSSMGVLNGQIVVVIVIPMVEILDQMILLTNNALFTDLHGKPEMEKFLYIGTETKECSICLY